ncbi:adenosylcobinamide-phosphate synthase CbiB [Thiohalophilus thiocyanatoxydans]|uniref:Cobalamin biosynthesis protein CobD n=1 Tax=Thiohalophilus thiocyanatoxydans TaxID=381308 RepID=A0A4R8IN65_9GAMM|nr:adenosylcobinamide-phosphate synthase CbiB [Thiohalophilus thiocyanatoxydans]TDX97897.1 adenosylcobinamide-phosphate synthase [Thiohalophilus thiocyanatoxydans]
MLSVAIMLAAVVLDQLLGDPRRYHPLAGFGRLVLWLEPRLYGPPSLRDGRRRWRGALGWLLLVAPPVALTAWLVAILPPWGAAAIEVLLLYLALGARSLAHHALRVAGKLEQNDLDGARHAVAMMVSRDTDSLTPSQISTATLESVLENGNDAVFATLFWFLLLGAPGVVLFRLANTLDAMWGYRNDRYRDFGTLAARLDDLLNWIPARLTALGYALLGHTRQALRCWRAQARHWGGINPGVVMASGAGALNRTLGGAVQYHGALRERPPLGAGPSARVGDIARAVRLVQYTLILWLVIIAIGGGLFATTWG